MTTLTWYDNESVEEALALASQERKPVLLDLWSPTCLGCAKLFVLTYSDSRVQEFVDEHFVCIKYSTKAANSHFKRLNGSFAHMWHPDLVVMDHRMAEVRRVIGYLPPPLFRAELTLALGLVQLYHGNHAQALATFTEVADGLAQEPGPEARYWAGVAAARAGGGLPALAVEWQRLRQSHPASTWAARADCLDVAIPEEGFRFGDRSSVTRLG